MFDAENAAERVLNTSEVRTNNGGNEVGMKDLKVYFYNLASAAINMKSVLEQLVANNAKLAATNEDLVAIVKIFSNEIKNLERETYRLNKTDGRGVSQGKRDLTLCPHCKN